MSLHNFLLSPKNNCRLNDRLFIGGIKNYANSLDSFLTLLRAFIENTNYIIL